MWIVFLAITLVLQTIFSSVDLKRREFKSFKPVLLSYIPALAGGYLLYGFSMELVFGFLYLSVILYLTELIGSELRYRGTPIEERMPLIGGIDIVAAPIYTVWFGYCIVPFLVVFLILMQVSYLNPVVKTLDKLCLNKNLVIKEVKIVPVLPILQTCCVLILALIFIK